MDTFDETIDDMVDEVIRQYKNNFDNAYGITANKRRLMRLDKSLVMLQKEVQRLHGQVVDFLFRETVNKSKKGSVLVLVVMFIGVMAILMSLTISSTILMVDINKTQNCSDAAALGASARIYGQESRPETADVALSSIINDLATANDCQVVSWEYGHWSGSTWTTGGSIEVPIEWTPDTTDNDIFTTSNFVNAVQVRMSRAWTAVPPINSTTNIEREAIAMVRYGDDGNGTVIQRGSKLVQ